MFGSVRSTPDLRDGFFAPSPVESIDVGRDVVGVPIRYYRTDCFLAMFTADLDAVAAAMPSDRLHPVRVSGGRAAVGVIAYNYMETGVGPYGEIGVAALCTFDKAAPPLLPLMLETRNPRFGAFVLHLPVTSRIARDAGRSVWGYPKFTADMAFALRPETQRVTLREGGRDVLRLDVRRGGRSVRDDHPVVTFSEHHGEVIRTTVSSRAVYQVGLGKTRGRLELGDHPVADHMRSLDMSTDAIATKSYLAHAAILPRGHTVATADRPYVGFAGSDAEFARHTVSYDDGVERIVTEPAAVAGAAG